MKTKFARISHNDSNLINSANIKKITKCDDVVSIKFSNTKLSRVKYRTLSEANWSNLKTYEIYDAEDVIRNMYELFIDNAILTDRGLFVHLYDEIFMFSNEAKNSNLDKLINSGFKVQAFTLDKNSLKKINESEQIIKNYKILTESLMNNQQFRNNILNQKTFDSEQQNLLKSNAADIENDLLVKYKYIVQDELDTVQSILFSAWN